MLSSSRTRGGESETLCESEEAFLLSKANKAKHMKKNHASFSQTQRINQAAMRSPRAAGQSQPTITANRREPHGYLKCSEGFLRAQTQKSQLCNKIPKDFSEQFSNSIASSSQVSVPSQSTTRRYGPQYKQSVDNVGHQRRMLVLAEDDDESVDGEAGYDMPMLGVDGEQSIRRPNMK